MSNKNHKDGEMKIVKMKNKRGEFIGEIKIYWAANMQKWVTIPED